MKARPVKALLRSQAGSTVIETAVVLPLTVGLLFAVLNFSIALFGYCNATYSARAATRYASLHSAASLIPATTASIQALVQPYLVGVPPSNSHIAIAYSGGNNPGQTVKITVSIQYSAHIPFSSIQNLAISSTAQRTITR
jgi:Flp pilus assembly protein TadG